MTDFFRVLQIDDSCFLFSELLWKAPEGLSDPAYEPTPEGDIYSVGIIVQEIVTRNPPYEEVRQTMDIDGKVYSV